MSAPDQARDTAVLGALALERSPGSAPGTAALAQEAAGRLGEQLARDLAGFAADSARLELALVGAHYDAAELLRPGWPLHRRLAQLAARAPGTRDGGRIVAFGAHEGELPDGLAPDPALGDGPLRLVPFVLEGDPGIATGVGDAFERDLVETGMAGAGTALLAQELFGLRIEHARYLTLHDLAAMMALQYEHAGLGALWPLLETALLSPDREAWLDAPPEPLAHLAGGEARIALFTPQAWRARYAADAAPDCERLERRFAQFQARQKQFAAVFGAHGIPVNFVHCDAGHDPEL